MTDIMMMQTTIIPIMKTGQNGICQPDHIMAHPLQEDSVAC